MRIFIDLTREKMVEYKQKMIDMYWDTEHYGYKMSNQYASKEEALTALMESFDESKGEPDIKTVE